MSSHLRNPLALLLTLTREERVKAGLLFAWFFLLIAALWMLKPIRTASLLAHLGAAELPYVRFGSVVAVGLVVLAYSRVVNRLSRLDVSRGANFLFATILVGFWLLMRIGGEVIGEQRWFVWAVFIMVDVYSTVMVVLFWTYTNDVVSRVEADRLYGPIGLGGILGGAVGGASVDVLVEKIGPVEMLLLCAAVVAACAGMAWVTERVLNPATRAANRSDEGAFEAAIEGARHALQSRYLLLITGVVVAYEFTAGLTDFVINVVFERAFHSQVEIAKMYGRLGWIVSATALLSQLVVAPVLLPLKRLALLVPPVVMASASVGLAIVPAVSMAFLLAASDRGLNYSLQQVTKETLYVPLTDLDRYKAKAFIDMFVDRAAKALSSVALIALIALVGVSIRVSLAIALVAMLLWMLCSNALGLAYTRRVRAEPESAGELDVPRSAD